jgi:hypothetical protein
MDTKTKNRSVRIIHFFYVLKYNKYITMKINIFDYKILIHFEYNPKERVG